MTYRIEFPISNYVVENEKTLSAYIDLALAYKDHISSLYFPLGHVTTALDFWGIRAPHFAYDQHNLLIRENILRWENAVQEIVGYAGLPVTILLNNTYSPHFSDPDSLALISRKLDFYRKRFTVKQVTISDTQLIPFLHDLDFSVCLSTNSHTSIPDLDRILYLNRNADFSGIVLQRDLNRRPKHVLRWFNTIPLDNLILLVNEGCISHCPYKKAGDLEISLDQVQGKINRVHNLGCMTIGQDPWLFLTSPFLTKKMLESYYPNVSTIKIAGRDNSVEWLKYSLRHWVDGEDLPLSKIMNVGGLPFTPGQLQQHPSYTADVFSCNLQCFSCRKCEHVYQDLIASKDSVRG